METAWSYARLAVTTEIAQRTVSDMIDKDVPIPSYYPFEKMEVGDSFLSTTAKRHNLSVAMLRYGRKTGKKFISRTLEDGSVRVWRVK